MDIAARPSTRPSFLRLGSLELNILTFIVFAASLLQTSIGFGVGNHALELPLVKLLRDASLYPGDSFARALESYPVILWRLVAALTRLVPLRSLLVTLFIGERLLVIYAARRLARAIAPGSMLAAVGAMAVFAFGARSLLGEGTMVENIFEHSGLAIAFLLLGMASFLELRPMGWALWTALAFNTTSLYGSYALPYFAVAFLLDETYRGQWRRWASAFALFLVLSSYPLYVGFQTAGQHPQDGSLWLAASHARSWWHLYPHEWEWNHYASAGALLGLLAFAVVYAGPSVRRIRRHAAAWTIVGASWLGLAFVAAYVVESPRLLILQPARGTDLWVAFSTVTMIALVAAKLEKTQVASGLAPVETGDGRTVRVVA